MRPKLEAPVAPPIFARPLMAAPVAALLDVLMPDVPVADGGFMGPLLELRDNCERSSTSLAAMEAATAAACLFWNSAASCHGAVADVGCFLRRAVLVEDGLLRPRLMASLLLLDFFILKFRLYLNF